MIFPVIVSVIPPTVCVAFAIYISFQSRKESGVKLFAVLLILLAAYGVFQILIQTQVDVKIVAHLSNLRTALWGFIAPLSYHTIAAFLKVKDKQCKIVLSYLYLAGIIIIILTLNGDSIFQEFYLSNFGWGEVIDYRGWFFWAFHLYLTTGIFAFAVALYKVRQDTENYRMQKLVTAILINFIWGGIFTIGPYCILSSFKLPSEIYLAYSGNVAIFIIVFVIHKYQPDRFSAPNFLLSLAPHLSADAIMITPGKKILWISKEKLLVKGFSRKELEGAGYEKLFINPAIIDAEMEKIKNNSHYSTTLDTECRTNNNSITRMKISISGLKNDFNDIIAYLIVFNKEVVNTNLLEYLQSSFNISEREKEVAALLLNDYGNQQISDMLFISLNTVKTHARNIYQKTNIANRKEFIALCQSLTK